MGNTGLSLSAAAATLKYEYVFLVFFVQQASMSDAC